MSVDLPSYINRSRTLQNIYIPLATEILHVICLLTSSGWRVGGMSSANRETFIWNDFEARNFSRTDVQTKCLSPIPEAVRIYNATWTTLVSQKEKGRKRDLWSTITKGPRFEKSSELRYCKFKCIYWLHTGPNQIIVNGRTTFSLVLV